MAAKTILVVDDEIMIAEDLCESLLEAGYHVLKPAHSGAEALQLFQQGHPDLVLMDIHLKGDMDGIATAHILHQMGDCAVIYLTANADRQILQRAKTTNPFGYLIKPFRERELHAMVEISLYKHAQEKAERLRQNLFTQTLAQTPDAILVLDDQERIQFLNPAAEELLKVSQQQAMGCSPKAWISFYEYNSHRSVSMDEIPNLQPVKMMQKDGTLVAVKVFKAVLRHPHGRFQGYMVNIYQEASNITGVSSEDSKNPQLTTICAACKHIRTPNGQFIGFESYFRQYYHIKFSHGICPACFEQLYPDYQNKNS